MIENNELVRQYYLNLFTSSAEKIKNDSNNHTFKWNMRDLELSKNAEIGLVQIANNNLTVTTERQYPPKLYNNRIEETTTTLLNKTVFVETLILNTDNISYGSGNYIIYSSSTHTDLTRKKYILFNENLTENPETFGGTLWALNNYNPFSGTYKGNNFIVNDYLGDWIIIKLPYSIILSKFRIYHRLAIVRAPALWRCYGSNDGINFIEIPDASNDENALTFSYYESIKYYEKVLNINTSYLYIGFTFNKLVGGSGESFVLNFNELQLFGREEIKTFSPEREYPPKLYNSFTPEITQSGEILNISPTTYYKETITLNSTGIKYGIGDYIIYSSSSFLDVARTRARLFNKTYISTIDDIGANWVYNGYNIVDGSFLLSSYIKNDYLGDWCIVKFPKPIILKRYIFYGRDTLIENAPSLWRFYGSNDGINFQIIQEASNDSIALTSLNYPMNSYEGFCNSNETSYLYIGFTVNKIVGNNSKTGVAPLYFLELELFGKEELNNTIIIRALDTYQDGFDSQNRTAAIVYMGHDLRTIKNPTYHKLISRNLNTFSLNMTDKLEDNYNGIRDDIDLGLIFHIKDYGEQKGMEEEITNNNLINIIE